jgi:colicin import membrane protein
MSSAQQAGFDAWLIKTYLECWKPAPQAADADPYVAQVRLAFNQDGSLAKPAKLVNPPSDPALKPQAKSVMAAVQNCNPLPVPAQYRPFYEQWRTETVHFNPRVAGR